MPGRRSVVGGRSAEFLVQSTHYKLIPTGVISLYEGGVTPLRRQDMAKRQRSPARVQHSAVAGGQLKHSKKSRPEGSE